MAENTSIEWCDATWNPWRGCEEVSPGCANCYAREFARRNPDVLGEWGKGSYRAMATEGYLLKPYQMDRKARRLKKRMRVFTGSMMDFFEDRDDLAEMRARVTNVMYDCHQLDFLVLTKRIQNALRLWPIAHPTGIGTTFGSGHYTRHTPMHTFDNLWLGVTVEDQKRADERIPLLQELHVRLRWLSVEPLLEEVDLDAHLKFGGIGWVIVGGESRQGGRCRPCQLEWIEAVVNQCVGRGVPVFVKQLGGLPASGTQTLRLLDRKGGTMDEWPDWLRRREFPVIRT